MEGDGDLRGRRGRWDRRGLLGGDHRLGPAEERLVVAGEDTRPRRAVGVSPHVAEIRDAGQAPRKGGRQRVRFSLPVSGFF